jgi:Ni,Fe-hydrogenase III component G
MIKTEDALAIASEILESWVWPTTSERPEPDRLDVTLHNAEDLVPMVVALRVKRLGYLSAITGLDLGDEIGDLELLYHFCTMEAIITLRVRLPRENPRVASLCEIIPSAEAFEREVREMFGVTITGLKNPQPLYLPEEWPKGVYPLRKDFDESVLSEPGRRSDL